MSETVFEYIAGRLDDLAGTAAEIRGLMEGQKECRDEVALALRRIVSSLKAQRRHLKLMARVAEDAERRRLRAEAAELALLKLRWVLAHEDRLDCDFFPYLHEVLTSIKTEGLSVRDVPGIETKQAWIELVTDAVDRANSAESVEWMSDWGQYYPTYGPEPDWVPESWNVAPHRTEMNEQLDQIRREMNEQLEEIRRELAPRRNENEPPDTSLGFQVEE